MNITHAEKEKINGDKLKAIFDRQKELMDKYHHIEANSGLLQTEDCPINLDDKRGQARIKDFSWRVMEEVGEALDAIYDIDHFQEELIDGLHFLTELTILAGKDYNSLVDSIYCNLQLEDCLDQLYYSDYIPFTYSLQKRVFEFVKSIGMMCNCLKNKPWKQTQMRTDKEMFYNRLTQVWLVYMSILCEAGMGPEKIAEVYLKKSQVNKFRQRSNY